jgi:hypothetical protein
VVGPCRTPKTVQNQTVPQSTSIVVNPVQKSSLHFFQFSNNLFRIEPLGIIGIHEG